MLRKTRLCQSAAILSLMFASAMAAAQEGGEACMSLDTAITVVRAQEYAPLIAEAAGTTAEEVEFLSFMESGRWSVVYAATPVADPGYFFFEDVAGQKQFKDVWGGVADASERDDQITYAEALGAPSDLAACFADSTAVIEE